MKIDGVSAEPSQGDNPFAMGPVALDIDCDLDVLAHKVGDEKGGVCEGSLSPRAPLVSYQIIYLSTR